MKKITLFGLLLLLTAQISFSQEKAKRITINHANHETLHRLIDEGIDMRCGTEVHGKSVTLELQSHELNLLKKNGIAYTVEIDDLQKFYKDRINKTRRQAQLDYEIERAMASVQHRSSNSSTTIDNFMEYVGCDEIDWATPANFPAPASLSMGGCLTVTQMETELDEMRAYSVDNALDIVSVKQDASPSGQTTWGNPSSTITNNGLTYSGQGGTRWDPQTMYYVRITGNESSTAEGTRPQILFTSMIHSREVGSLMSNIFFMWYLIENYDTNPAVKNLVDNNELYFIPVVNPDGLRWNQHVSPGGGAFQRKNLRPNTGGTGNTSTDRGVDLNRNFNYFWGSAGSGSSGTPSNDSYRGPSAASEPETQILVDFILARNFKTCIMNHTTANGIPHPYGGNPTFVSDREDEMHKWHEDMTRYNRYVSGARIFSAANGIADDWMVGGDPDGNGSSGSGQKILATTPEHGDSGFWPPLTDIIPIAKRSMRISFMTAYYGGRYAKFHDLTQSDIQGSPATLTFGIERLGQTASDFTLTVTPVSANIDNIVSPATQSGMTILEQREVTAQLTLLPGVQPNDKIEYRVQLADGNGNIFYDANFEKYYQPNTLLADNPDTDILTNWTSSGSGDWTASTAAGARYSGSRGIKQGGNAINPYSNNDSSTLTTASTYNFSNANEVLVQFYTKWDLERNYDFVEFQGSTNGSTWQTLCGRYNKPNSTSSTNSAHALKGSSASFQSSNSSGQVYDGDRFDNWVMEEIVINASNNSFLLGATNAQFRFVFASDGDNQTENYSTTRDGFFFDDFKIIELQIPCDASTPPTGLNADIVTSISASVSWDAIPSATYDLRYREVGAPSWNEVTDLSTNTYNILGLTPNTDYEVQVRTRCTSTTSSYSSSETFTTPNAVACTGGNDITVFPYSQGFENANLGFWLQSANGSVDDIDWTRNNGPTGSTNTGPTGASEGSFYIYTEASTNVSPAGSPNKTAYLTSPCIDFSGYENPQIQFDYHMYGAEIGSITLEVSTDGTLFNPVFSISDQQQTSNGEAWRTTDPIDLSLYSGQTVKLRITGLTGSGFNSDLSVDNINITADALSAPPIAACQDITVQLDGSGSASIIPSQINNGSSDDVGITSFSLDIDTFDCSDVGTVTVTLTVEDADGQTDTCTATVTVEDNIDPVPTTGTLADINESCEVTTLTPPTANDNCDGVINGTSPATASLPITSSTTITWTYTDSNGNSVQQTQDIVINDTTNPVPTAGSLADINAQCEVTALTPPTANDNCDGVINGTSPATASLPITSSTTITWTYTDSNGNSVQQTQDIVINDTTNPVPTAGSLADVNAQCEVTALTPPTANDNCDGVINGTSPATASLPITSSTTITWTYTDSNGNSVQQTQDIVINDTTNPVPTAGSLADVNAQCEVTALTPPTANDNCDGVINGTSPATASLPITSSTTITWTYTDSNGNSVQQTQDIVINDTTNPVPVSGTLADINAQCEVTALTPPTANDNCDGVINGTSPATASLPITSSTTITWTYTDSNGNSVQQTQDIVINDTTNPVPVSGTLADINAQCEVTALTPPTANDNCDGVINGTSPATASLPITSSTTITWTYTDSNGNSVQQTQDIVINDTTNPVPVSGTLADINAQCEVTALTPPTANDNCDGVINGTSPATASLPITSSTTITWTYTDSNGNSVQQTQDIVINDTTNPVPTAGSLADVNAQCEVTALTPPTANDNCDGVINGTSPATVSLPITSSTTITWTYTDSNGNSVQQTQDIVINDTTNPVPTAGSLADINAQCEVTTLTPPTANDNCDGVINGTSPATASLPITSSTTITWTYTDSNGNSVQQTQDIVINDTTNPVPTAGSLADINAQCEVTTLTPPTANDNCDGVINGTSPATASLPITSSTTITWTYTDSNGNSVQQTQDIVINDTTNPVPTAGSLADINAQCEVTALTPPTANDNCDGVINGTSPATASLPITSSTTITWTYTDSNGNSVQQTQDIVINDTTNPVPTAGSLADVNAQCEVTALTPPTANDNCDGVINGTSPATASLPITSSTTITWTYTDSNGNSVQQTQDIVINDTTNPVPTAGSLADINAQCEVTTLTPPTANDNCDGVINGTSPATASLPITSSTTITWTYTDSNGNSVQQTQDIVINDTTNPVPTAGSLADINAQCEVTTLTPPTANDNCDGVINGTSPATASLPITSSTTITWTYTDSNGNSVQQTQDIVINDTTNPVPTAGSLADINAQCEVTTLTPPTANDNCDGVINGTSPATASLPITSSTTITWTYTDSNGNSVQQTQDIVINDTTNPVPTAGSLADINAQCEVTTLTPPTANDNCDGVINGTSPATASLPITSSTTITWTYTDSNGNSVQQTQDIVINDTIDPVCITQDISVELDGMGNATITASQIDDGSSDNCGIASISVSPSSFTVLDIGDNTVTLTVTDTNGNTSNCNATVTVTANTLGIDDDIENEDLSIQPNPFRDRITIKLPSSLIGNTIDIRIFDLNGRLVYQKRKSSDTDGSIIVNDLDDLEEAPYFIRLTDQSTGLNSMKKLIKY